MPVTPDRLSRLREFGLSEYAARAYLALLDLGITEARDVSSLSKVPQAKIYSVLEQLHEKGLVTILPEFPKKYAPVPFDEYLGRIYDEHTRAAATIEGEREQLAELFRVMGDVDAGDRGFFTVLRGRRNVVSRLEEMFGKVERDLLMMVTAGSGSRLNHFLPHLKRAHERGVSVRILAPLEPETLASFAMIADSAQVRQRHLPDEESGAHVGIVLVDGHSAFLIHWVPDDSSIVSGKDTGVFTDQEAMVAAVRAIVEPHWSRAATYAQRRAEIQSGRPAEFTRIYTHKEDAWRALLDATKHGAREVRTIDAQPRAALQPEERELLDVLRRAGARWSSLVHLPDAAAVHAHEGLASDPHVEVRHSPAPTLGREWLVDGREAIVALAPRNGPSVFVHTNQAAVIAALRGRFDAAWENALPFAARRRELEMFPRVAPSDLGIGPLFHVMPDAVIVSDAQGQVLLWNPAATAIFGYTPTEALNLKLQDLAGQDFHVGASVERALMPGAPPSVLEGRASRKDGRSLAVEWTVAGLVEGNDGRPVLISVVRDITERREANARIVRIYETMSEAFYALDREWRFVYRNPVTRAMTKIPASEIDGKVLWDVFPELRGSKFDTEFHRAMEQRVPVSFEEHYPRMGRWFEVRAYPSADGLSVFYRDISTQKRAEQALRQSEERAQRLMMQSPVAISVVSPEGKYTLVNEAYCRLLGATQEELLGTSANDHTHPDDVAAGYDVAAKIAAQDEPYAFEKRYVRKDGTIVHAHLLGTLVRDADGKPVEYMTQAQPTHPVSINADEAPGRKPRAASRGK